jgi:hypothetical protein
MSEVDIRPYSRRQGDKNATAKALLRQGQLSVPQTFGLVANKRNIITPDSRK